MYKSMSVSVSMLVSVSVGVTVSMYKSMSVSVSMLVSVSVGWPYPCPCPCPCPRPRLRPYPGPRPSSVNVHVRAHAYTHVQAYVQAYIHAHTSTHVLTDPNPAPAESWGSAKVQFWSSTISVLQLYFSPYFRNRFGKRRIWSCRLLQKYDRGCAVAELRFFTKLRICHCKNSFKLRDCDCCACPPLL